MSKKSTEIVLNNYQKLLTEVQNNIQKTGKNIVKIVTRQKVVMGWEIGKIIDEHLIKNSKSGYGDHLFAELEKDTTISQRVLYQMHNFYKTYPKLPKDDDDLNWSHYRVLSGIKKAEERKYIEDLTRKNSWDVRALQEETKKLKNNSTKNAKNETDKTNTVKKPATAKLRAERGKLFSYQLAKFENTGKTYIDLGFNIFKEVEENLPKVSPDILAVDVFKKTEKYSLTESSVHSRKFNTYKAYLDRVVDGDTIRLNIDLGFKIFHKEIIRLKGVDAPEIKTKEGKESLKILSDILKKLPFFIIKTIKIDIYGRYVADLFFDETTSQPDPQKISNEGIYLNQLLLDKGSVAILR